MLAIVRSPIALWAGFVLAHLWLGMLALYAPGQPIGDVTSVYKFWIVDYAFEGHGWVGIDTVWVYPILAIVPMIAAAALGPDLYASTWLSLVMLVDAIAFAVTLTIGRRYGSTHAGWWWLGFLVALGPVAVGRIDSITVPLALLGMLVVVTRPALGGVLLTVAAWTKVWPAALVAAVVVALRDRGQVIIGAAATTATVLAVALALGAGGNVFSFISQQADRGLQIESVVATPWMWDATLGSGHSRVYYDTAILTFQLRGDGVQDAAAVATPLLALVALALLGLGVLATRRGRSPGEVLPPLVLALTVAMIIFNKVGSPQFVTWLAVPVVFGLMTAASGVGRSFRVPAVLGIAIAALTHAFYPYFYYLLLGVPQLSMVMVLTARNLLYVALFAWAVVALVDVVRRPRDEAEDLSEGDAALDWMNARR
ncbi:glycosyltransferase 87 family protein [Pseudolysinimonas sp.]|uniref:glycosyltransferase 87 family protein n=1 Tax=Pseudolysinimonas sp. TaxID=2680009 RepID=UPI00286AA41B|nr:glycosyltransferase 87 family protein [Pseudolysinimonas sp.]